MYYLKYSQKLPLTIEKAWDFFSSPHNLEKITPAYMNFKILNQDDIEKMYAGQIIYYTIQPIANMTLNWVTEITHVQEPYYFIDEQRFGPYKFWHHEHRFESIPNGIEITDIIYYDLPLGPIGKMLNFIKVEKDVKNIFNYRREKLEKMFGSYTAE